MDEIVLRAMERWPNAPAVYGWLRLDARGNWRLKNPATGAFEAIGNVALREFIGRNYVADERGRWYFQNGPQRVFVGLERAPLVFRLDGGMLIDHCGRHVERLTGVWLDASANVFAVGDHGPGSLDDRDLGAFSEQLVDSASDPVGERSLDAASAWASRYGILLLQRITTDRVEAILGFQAEPAPEIP